MASSSNPLHLFSFLLLGLPFLCLTLACHPQEAEALLHLKAAINDSPTLRSWANGTDCCNWDGILCHNHTNRVVRVDVYRPFSAWFGNQESMQGGVIPDSLCHLRFLNYLALDGNGLSGSIPSCLANLSHLTELYLSRNHFSGTIPSSLGSLSSLRLLTLWDNELSGKVPATLGNLSLLTYLAVSTNQLSGTLPFSFAGLHSLKTLLADTNAFNESISSSALPSSLEALSLSFSHNQTISETFFHNSTKLKALYLSNCLLNMSITWIPAFQLQTLCLVSCNIDGRIPLWIASQLFLEDLTLAHNNLVGEIPSWLWDTSSALRSINLTANHLEGGLFANSSTWMQINSLDLSSNALSGSLPSLWSYNIERVLLNDNLFTGIIPPSLGNLSPSLQELNLANNKLSGIIPSNLGNCSGLQILHLGNNRLKGRIPREFGKLSKLHSLVVRTNNLDGSFPHLITNCTNLQLLDIGDNSFSGPIPKSIANLSMLKILVMQRNDFEGNIPKEIGQLKNLQILQLSSNHLSGSIPHTIVCLQAMTIAKEDGFALSYTRPYNSWLVWFYISMYRDDMYTTTKGRDEHYPYILSTFRLIDLSNNKLNGTVPSDFGKLKGLRSLNLSRNNLHGTIPSSLGELQELDSLDLSMNMFSGRIPGELESLSFLGSLNLSNNNLSGIIPQGQKLPTFPNSSYSGNQNLWGCPLPKNCPWPEFASLQTPPDEKGMKTNKTPWYEIAVGLSWGASFGATISLIVLSRWRRIDALLKHMFPWIQKLFL